jgi:hypothetical protein
MGNVAVRPGGLEPNEGKTEGYAHEFTLTGTHTLGWNDRILVQM